MWGISPSFWHRLFFFWSIIYTFTLLASACVGLLHFLKAGYWGIFCHALLLCSDHASCCCHSTNRKTQWTQRPYSCHLAGMAACTWAGTHCHSSGVTTHHHGGGGGRAAPPAAAPGQICAIAWAFFTQTRPSVSGGVLNVHLTPMQAEGIFLLCSLWRTCGELKMGRLKNKMKQKGVGEGSSWIKFYY